MRQQRTRVILNAALMSLGVAVGVGCSSDPVPKPAAVDMTDSAQQMVDTEMPVAGAIEEEQTSLENVPPSEPPAGGLGMAVGAIENAALLFIAEQDGATGLSVLPSARFYTIATPLENEPVLKAMPMLDTCEVGSESSQINANALNLPIDHLLEASGNEILQVAAVSAGETAELDYDAGSYVSLLKTTVRDAIEYSVQDGTSLSVATPDTLNMNVSGDAFPQLTSSWNTPQRLDSGIRDALRSIETSSVITWTASSSSESEQSRLHIYAGFLDELTGGYKSYQCELADDGEFALPEDVQALYQDGLAANFVDVARYTRSVQLINGISVVNVFVQKF